MCQYGEVGDAEDLLLPVSSPNMATFSHVQNNVTKRSMKADALAKWAVMIAFCAVTPGKKRSFIGDAQRKSRHGPPKQDGPGQVSDKPRRVKGGGSSFSASELSRIA